MRREQRATHRRRPRPRLHEREPSAFCLPHSRRDATREGTFSGCGWFSLRMIPYIHVATLKIGPIALHPFGILVALGVWTGLALATRRARALGVDLPRLHSFVAFVLVGGFVGGHVLDELFYH